MTDQDQGPRAPTNPQHVMPRAPTNPQHVMLQRHLFNLLAGASEAPLTAKQHKGLEQSVLILEGYLNAQFPETKTEDTEPEKESEEADASEHQEQPV